MPEYVAHSGSVTNFNSRRTNNSTPIPILTYHEFGSLPKGIDTHTEILNAVPRHNLLPYSPQDTTNQNTSVSLCSVKLVKLPGVLEM